MQELIKLIQSKAMGKKERCGVILEDGTVKEITNISKNDNSFIFSKLEWFSLLNTKANIKAVWHTHPQGTAEPSEADLAFMINSRYDSLIVSKKDWRYFRCLET